MPGYGMMLSTLARETMFRPHAHLRLGDSAVDLAEMRADIGPQTLDLVAAAATR
jgi:hypothetical protein